MLEPALDDLGELERRRLAAEHGLERAGADVRVGHPRVGELPDVGGDAVQLLERLPPGDGAGPSGRDERSVDVKQQDPRVVGHRPRG